MKRIKPRTGWSGFMVLAVLAALALSISGCYVSDQEIITANDAVSIYNLTRPFNYLSPTNPNDKSTISPTPGSHDYRFQRAFEGKVENGYLRAINIKDDIYAIQLKSDNDPTYYIVFYRLYLKDGGLAYSEVDVPLESLGAVDELAEQYEVEQDTAGSSLDTTLEGSRENILKFLHALKALPFEAVN